MDSGITVRPRRRRRPPPPPTTAAASTTSSLSERVSFGNGEMLQDRRMKNVVPSHHPPASTSSPDDSGAVTDGNDDHVDVVDDDDEEEVVEEKTLLLQFQTAVQMTSQASWWSTRSKLIAQVVHTSLRMRRMEAAKSRHHPKPNYRTATPTTFLLLTDQASDLLAICRILVKEATDSDTSAANVHHGDGDDDGSNNTSDPTASPPPPPHPNDHRLLVAIHGLRAVLWCHTNTTITTGKSVATNNNNSQPSAIDTIRRLLYFGILHIPTTTTTNNNNNHPTKRRHYPDAAVVDRNCLAEWAYQALGQTLDGYTFTIPVLHCHYQCQTPTTTPHRAKDHSQYLFSCPIPQPQPPPTENRTPPNDNDDDDTITHQPPKNTAAAAATEQVAIMCLAATMTMARRRLTHATAAATSSTPPRLDCRRGSAIADVRSLVCEIAIPWIRTLALLVHQSTTAKDATIVSYCKKAHRILYDCAEMITTTTTTSEDDDDDGVAKLELQADSIRALLLDAHHDPRKENHDPYEEAHHDDIIRAIFERSNLFDPAATYAWKMADSYYSRSKDTTTTTTTNMSLPNNVTPLAAFHDQVGTLLDSFHMTEHKRRWNRSAEDTNATVTAATTPTLPSYVEYCVYRSLHTTTAPSVSTTTTTWMKKNQPHHHHHHTECLFCSLPYHYYHGPCPTPGPPPPPRQVYDANEAFLLLWFLSRWTRYGLEQDDDDETDQHHQRFSQIPSDRIIQEFRCHYIPSSSSSSSSSSTIVDSAKRLRCYQLFSLLGLHRAVHRLVEHSKPSSDRWSKYWNVARSILADGMAPFGIGLLEDVKDEKQRAQIWTFIISCHRSAISVNESSHATDRSNQSVMELSACMLTHKLSPSPDVITSIAKFFYGMGKTRYELGNQVDSLLPLLHSVKLFLHVASMVTPTTLPSLKISGRLTFIATIYKALDLIDESITVTMLALVFDSIEVSTTNPYSANESSDLIPWLATFTENVIVLTSNTPKETTGSRSENRLGLLSSLLQSLMKRRRSQMVPDSTVSSKNGAMKTSSVIDLLLQSLNDGDKRSFQTKFEARCNVPFSLVTISGALVSNKAIPRNGELDKSSIILEFVKLMTELLVRFGYHLQSSQHDVVDDSAASITDYVSVCRFTESLMSKLIFYDSERLPLAIAMMNLVASISLVSAHRTIKFEGWVTDSFSKRTRRGKISYIDSAKKLADIGYAGVCGSNICDRLSFAALTAIELYRYQLSHLQEKELPVCPINFERLQGFYDKVDSMVTDEGNDSLNWRLCMTTTLSRLCLLLYLEGEGLRALQIAKWNCSTISEVGTEAYVWSETILLTLVADNSIVAMCPRKTKSFHHPVNFEEQACKLRLQSRDADYSLEYVEKQFQNLLDNLCDRSSDFGPDFHDVRNWTLTTIYLGLSECAERQGRLELSMAFLKKCFDGCKTTISTIRNQRKSNRSCTAWYSTAQTYISLSCLIRQDECLSRTGHLYQRMGNYRKSLEYSFASLHSPVLESAGLTSKFTFAQVVSLTRQYPARNSNETKVRRLYLRLKSLACSLDIVADQFRNREDQLYLSLVDDTCKGAELFVNCELETIADMYEIADMMNGHQLSPSRCNETVLNQQATKKFVRYSLSSNVAKLFRTILSLAKCSDKPYLQLQYNARLRDAVDALSKPATDETRYTVISWLEDICASQSCSALCRAWSYYLLGSMSLKSARNYGEEGRKRNNSTSTEFNVARLADARNYFTRGLQLLGTSRDLLTRSMQRCLAVTFCSGAMNDSDALSCFTMINDSVGGTAVGQVRNYCPKDATEGDGKNDLIEIFDAQKPNPGTINCRETPMLFLEELGKVVPTEWRFITATLSATGELLLTSLEFSEQGEPSYTSACIGPEAFASTDSTDTADIFDKIVKPLNEIVSRSQQQLAGESIADTGDETSKEDATRRWWQIRKQVDSDLQEHLETVERALLSSETVQHILLGRTRSNLNESAEIGDELPCGNLASRFDEASNEREMHPITKNQRESKRSARKTKGQSVARSLFDEDLDDATPKHDVSNECIFLILDEYLVSFPFEGLSCFDGKAVCRLPSLAFALDKLSVLGVDVHDGLAFDPKQTSYILDPESNLSGTKDRLGPFLDSIQSDCKYPWNNVVGEIPPADFLETSLRAQDGLLLYFGHGGGQQFCGRGKLESLSRDGPRKLSSVILMGCGSGRLESVNTKHSKSACKLPIHYEPEGVAMSYLLAGSLCVVGNLWDVTDRDIDRYSMHLLKSIYDTPIDDGTKSMAHCVADARQVCKMRYIVGCAPVCYGFPIFARHK